LGGPPKGGSGGLLVWCHTLAAAYNICSHVGNDYGFWDVYVQTTYEYTYLCK